MKLSQYEQVYAYVNEEQSEKKLYSAATINNDFADDTIIITLTKKATFEFKDYLPEDFGIDCERIKELTELSSGVIKKHIKTAKTMSILKKRVEEETIIA